MHSTMLVGYDRSAPSRAALRWAAQRASDLGTSVLLCHVLDEEDQFHSRRPDFGSEVDCLRWLESESARARRDYPSVDFREVVHTGSPAATLAQLSHDADMVVVGTHKTGFIYGRAFGSRFAAVASGTLVPLAVIPDSDIAHRRGVVAGVVGFPTATALIRHAAVEALRWDDPLTLLGPWVDGVPAEANRGLPRDRTLAAQREGMLRDAARFAQAEYPALIVKIRSVRRDRAEALIDASLSARALVIGEASPSSAKSVVPDVLLNLACPTIVVHEPDPPSLSSTHPAIRSTGKSS